MRFEPQGAGRNGRIYFYLSPPRGFVATAMHLAMMSTAQGDGELIADFSSECPALRKAQVVCIARLAVANQTRLLGHVSNVLAVANPARLRQGQHALIDYLRSRPVLWLRRTRTPQGQGLRRFACRLKPICVRRRKTQQSRLETLLHGLRIGNRQFILFSERPMRPDCSIIATGQITEFGEESIAKRS